MILRPYQTSLIDGIRSSYARGNRAPLAVLPTGGGKSAVAGFIGQSVHRKGSRCAILIHRHELLEQLSQALDKFDVPHGFISPKFGKSDEMIQIASVQTLSRRLHREPMELDFIIIDEAHHATASTWGNIIKAFPKAKLLGLTATPCRSDGKGLGVHADGFFDDMIVGPTVRELIDGGFLAPFRLFLPPTEIDMTGVKKRYGDFEKKETAARIDKPRITGSAVEHYRAICPYEPAIAFCISREHAGHVAREFRDQGFKFEVIDGTMTTADRRRLIAGLADGSLNGLVSVDLIGEGVDIPVATAAVCLRPTDSTSLWLQSCGRVLRPHPSKAHGIIIDHVGNSFTHGFVDDVREWTLDNGAPGDPRQRNNAGGGPRVSRCPSCYCGHPPAPSCPQCHFVYPVASDRKFEEGEGELKEASADDLEAIRRARKQQERDCKTEEDLIALGYARGYKSPETWARMKWEFRRSYRRKA